MELYPELPASLGAGCDDDARVTGQPVPVDKAHGRGDHADERVFARAAQVLAIHRLSRDGWCKGCRDEAGVLAFHPCVSASWASSVLAAAPAPRLLSPNVGGG